MERHPGRSRAGSLESTSVNTGIKRADHGGGVRGIQSEGDALRELEVVVDVAAGGTGRMGGVGDPRNCAAVDASNLHRGEVLASSQALLLAVSDRVTHWQAEFVGVVRDLDELSRRDGLGMAAGVVERKQVNADGHGHQDEQAGKWDAEALSLQLLDLVHGSGRHGAEGGSELEARFSEHAHFSFPF